MQEAHSGIILPAIKPFFGAVFDWLKTDNDRFWGLTLNQSFAKQIAPL